MINVIEKTSKESLEKYIKISKEILTEAKSNSLKLLDNTNNLVKKIEADSYNQGLVSGVSQLLEKLIDIKKIDKDKKAEIKKIIIDVTKSVLNELLLEVDNQDQKNKILEKRINKFLTPALNNISNKIKLLLPLDSTKNHNINLFLEEIKKRHPTLIIEESEEISSGGFKICSKYGSISSDPRSHLENILENFEENITHLINLN